MINPYYHPRISLIVELCSSIERQEAVQVEYYFLNRKMIFWQITVNGERLSRSDPRFCRIKRAALARQKRRDEEHSWISQNWEPLPI
jgi:hypothetical protein